MVHLSKYHEDHPNQHKSSHKVCDKTEYPSLSFTEGQWEPRQYLDQNFQMKERHCRTNTSARRNK